MIEHLRRLKLLPPSCILSPGDNPATCQPFAELVAGEGGWQVEKHYAQWKVLGACAGATRDRALLPHADAVVILRPEDEDPKPGSGGIDWEAGRFGVRYFILRPGPDLLRDFRERR